MKETILKHIPAACPWRDTLQWYDTIDSTNTMAKTLAALGAPHGTVLVAGSQTAGRGRQGRSFHSPAGKGLYLSLILRPNCPPTQLMHLTCAVGVAVCDAVEAVTNLRPGIKWINDLVVGKQKLGGILTELSVSATGNTDYAIVGIGLNCNHLQTDFPPELREIATSLRILTGQDHPPALLAGELIHQLYRLSLTLHPEKEGIMNRYRQDCVTLGKEIVAIRGEEKRYGTALTLLDDGSLIVAFDDGSQEAVSSGEVSIRGMYGYL